MARVIFEFSHRDIEELCTMVICEGWEKKKHGKARKAYSEEFTESERQLLASLYPQIYKWNLVTGIPQHVKMKVSTYVLLEKACNFFGGI